MRSWRFPWRFPWWLPIAALVAACASDVSGPDTTNGVTAASGPPSSVATTSVLPEGPDTTTAPIEDAATIVGWLSQQRASGLDQTILEPNWSTEDAVIVTAYTRSPSLRGDLVVALQDGRIAPLPLSMQDLLPETPTQAPNVRLSHLDGSPLLVMVADDGRTVVASRLDPDLLTWTDLEGITPLAAGERLDLYTAGAHALFVHWDNTVTEAYVQWGEMVSPDGTVSRMADPPADTPIWFTNDAGGRAILLGLDTVAEVSPHLPAPVAFDPPTNTWLEVPAPEWLPCGRGGTRCRWADRHEYSEALFFRTTPAGVVAVLPDGSYGLLDPVALTWRRIDDPPIDLPGPIVAAVGADRLIALPGVAFDGTQALGIAVWLDLTTGTWITEQIVDPSGWVAPVWWEPRWWGDVLLLGADADEVGNPPRVAIDLITGEVRPPRADELAAWPSLALQVPIGDLVDAWQRRLAI